MKIRRQIVSIIITSFVVFNLFISMPTVSVAPISPVPDQFIAEIFPNSTLPLQLMQSNTIITFNGTNFNNKLDIHFDANYTLHNLGNTSTIPLIIPFSLTIDITTLIIEVQANYTQLPYELFEELPWNETMTIVDIYFLPHFYNMHPITLIKSQATIFKNRTSVIRVHFSGSIINPLKSKELLYIEYYEGSSQHWRGNTTGRIEFRVYGKQPIFSVGGLDHYQLVDISGGRSLLTEWNNSSFSKRVVGLKYYREASLFEKIGEFIVFQLSPFIGIAFIILIGVIISKKIKRS